ncbi:unnamed protein product [Blepharisma stoltei]|uniref:Tetratricopeptide repeat protein n=1 Tax=Blepharisma stoltei TaxID=1481888 RepID=A0AAU9INW4_9CILI|nr:unnamed protein product [Blepharisma stoltei]
MENIKEVISKANYLKSRNQQDEALEVLEEAFNRFRSSHYETWEIAKLLAEMYLTNSELFDQSGLVAPAFEQLQKALKITNPSPLQRWKERIDWQLLRISIYTTLAEHYRRELVIYQTKQKCDRAQSK